jgi:hypothetical protein
MSITVNRPTQRIEFCTVLGLKAEHEDAVAVLAEATKQAEKVKMENGGGAKLAAAERIAAIEEQMRDHTIVFTLAAWPRKRWVEFEESHPAREGHEDDKSFSIDVSSLDEVIAGSVQSVKAPDGRDVPFHAPTEWVALADEMTSGQWNEFALAILRLNRGVTAAPFSPLASRVIRRSSENS